MLAQAESNNPERTKNMLKSTLTIRAIVSSKKAGVIIGKAGKNVADLRDETGVKAGVSKFVPRVHDRVLTVTGALKGISKAYAIVAKGLLEGVSRMGMGGVISTNGTHSVRLLISHNQIRTIIGRQSRKIKHIQDVSGVRMVAQKNFLPQSSEQIVEVQGTPEGIQKATWKIEKCLVNDWQRGTGTVPYNPTVRAEVGRNGAQLNANGGTEPAWRGKQSYNPTGNRADFGENANAGGSYNHRSNSDATFRPPPQPAQMEDGKGADFGDNANARGSYNRCSNSDTTFRPPQPAQMEDGEHIETQNISIPSDKIGFVEVARIDALNLSPTQKELIKLAAAGHVKMNMENIIRIWQVDKQQIPGLKRQFLWVEDNKPNVGYQHMLNHANEFREFDITNDQLPEVAEAATKIGILGFLQGKRGNETDRPVFGLNFYGNPLAVAISVGNNGFVIGMNASSLDKFKVM